jgi:hypothetical protein
VYIATVLSKENWKRTVEKKGEEQRKKKLREKLKKGKTHGSKIKNKESEKERRTKVLGCRMDEGSK